MPLYRLRSPVAAIRYQAGKNDQAVFDMLNGPEGRQSFRAMNGRLEVYNAGPAWVVEDGEWVVRCGQEPMVISNESFLRDYEEVAE